VTDEREEREKSSPQAEPLLRFRIPEVQEVGVVIVRLENGRRVARSPEELEELEEAG